MATYFFQNNFYLNIKKESVTCVAWALILPFIFFSSLLLSQAPELNFFGDLYNLYFPQFVEGYHLAKNGTFSGIDLLTNNGASAYFLRPNIPAFYPVYQLVYALFDLDNIEELSRAFVFTLYFHSVLALYFSMKVGQKFFSLDTVSSLLLGVLYFCTIAHSYPIAPFYFVAALFPLLLYVALCSLEESTWWRLILFSFAYILNFLSGYLPLDVNATALALIFSGVYAWQNPTEKPILNRLLCLIAPVTLASAIVLPAYLMIVNYHKLVPGIPDSVWYSAHDMAYQTKDLFALISSGFLGSHPGSELPHITIGLLPLLLLILGFTQRKKFTMSAKESNLISVSLIIFIFYLLLAFGQATGLPDLFYFMVPGLGKMHLYGRYLPIASFFLFLTVAISFKHLVQKRKNLPLTEYTSVIIVTLIVFHVYSQFSESASIRPKFLVLELLMCSLVILSLSVKLISYSYLGVITLSFFSSATHFNSYTNSFNMVAPPPYKNTVVFSEERRDILRNYFKQNSDKTLIKYADLTSSIEKRNGIMLNYPWMVQDTIKLSNYMGYELHTSVDMDYLTRFPYFGIINLPWLLRTGADFIIYDAAAWDVHEKEIAQWINHDVPELDIWYGYKVAKLKDAAGLVDYVPARNSTDFDNGIVRISNDAGQMSIKGFETDFASKINFKVESTSPITIKYLFFPNKAMTLFIDGKQSDRELKNGLLEFILSSGAHTIEYKYVNQLHQLFINLCQFYIALMTCIILWRTSLIFTPFSWKQKLTKRFKL